MDGSHSVRRLGPQAGVAAALLLLIIGLVPIVAADGRMPADSCAPPTSASLLPALGSNALAWPVAPPTSPCTATTTAAVIPVATDPSVCDETNVHIDIDNVTDLYGYQFKVTYDPALLSAAATFDNTWFDPTANGFGGPPGWQADCNNTLGVCQFARTRGYPDGPLSGSGAVANLVLTSKLPPLSATTSIAVSDVILSDRDGYKILPVTAGSTPLTVCGRSPATFARQPTLALASAEPT